MTEQDSCGKTELVNEAGVDDEQPAAGWQGRIGGTQGRKTVELP